MFRSLLFLTLILIFSNCSKESAQPLSSVSGKWVYDYDSLSWESGKVYSPNINYLNFQSNGALYWLNEPGDHILDSFQYNQTSTNRMIWTHSIDTGGSVTYVYDTLNILILNSRNLYMSCPLTYIDTAFKKQNGVIFYTLSR